MIVLAFSFLQLREPGKNREKLLNLVDTKWCTSQTDYCLPSPSTHKFGVSSAIEVNKNQYEMDGISYLQK